MSDNEIFNKLTSVRLAEYGKNLAASKKQELLGFFQMVAKEIATRDPHRECDADRLAAHCWNRYRIDSSKVLGNASGSIFKSSCWVFTGKWTKSSRIRSHGRDVKVWRLVDPSLKKAGTKA